MSFQFTHPVRGATWVVSEVELSFRSFNSRTPCGVRPGNGRSLYDFYAVSIHAPRAGCDKICPSSNGDITRFNSRTPCGVRLRAFILTMWDTMFQFTHPVRGATLLGALGELQRVVSIHAPRAGCDL